MVDRLTGEVCAHSYDHTHDYWLSRTCADAARWEADEAKADAEFEAALKEEMADG
jgi:hypothetical protein